MNNPLYQGSFLYLFNSLWLDDDYDDDDDDDDDDWYVYDIYHMKVRMNIHQYVPSKSIMVINDKVLLWQSNNTTGNDVVVRVMPLRSLATLQ